MPLIREDTIVPPQVINSKFQLAPKDPKPLFSPPIVIATHDNPPRGPPTCTPPPVPSNSSDQSLTPHTTTPRNAKRPANSDEGQVLSARPISTRNRGGKKPHSYATLPVETLPEDDFEDVIMTDAESFTTPLTEPMEQLTVEGSSHL